MSGTQTAIEVYDGASGPLMEINNVLSVVSNSFESMRTVSSQAFDVSVMQMMHQQLVVVGNGMNQVSDNIREGAAAQDDLNASVNEGAKASGGLFEKIKNLAGEYANLESLKNGIGHIINFTSAYDTQQQAEMKLTETMRTRMGASDEMTNSVQQLIARERELGVVGDEVQMAGAQELATFLSTTDSLNTLIPAMNNLAVEQSGLGASQSNLAEIGNLMGEAMQGETDALAKAGVSFTQAQQAAMKYGTEQERAAVLSQVITDSVGNMNQAMAETPQGKVQQLQNAWGDIQELVGERLYSSVINFFDLVIQNMPLIEAVAAGFAEALAFIINLVSLVIEGVAGVGEFILDNWSVISPVIYGIIAALGVYAIYLGIVKGIAVVSAGIQAASLFVTTAAQQGLNAAMAACPIFWIMLAVIALVAAIYFVVDAYNKWTGSTVSAAGIICGIIFTAGAFIGNLFVALVNATIDIFVVLWNFIAAFANFFGNVFNDPVGSIARLFFDLADTVLGVLQTLASAIDTIFGSNLASHVQGWRNDLGGWVDDTFGKGEEVMKKLDSKDLHVNRFEYEGAWNTGYQLGKNTDSGISGFLDKFNKDQEVTQDNYGLEENFQGLGSQDVPENIGNISEDTSTIKETVSVTNEEITYLRETAEKEAVNRFTTAEIKIDMKNTNMINSDMDLDGVVNRLETELHRAMKTAKEGA